MVSPFLPKRVMIFLLIVPHTTVTTPTTPNLLAFPGHRLSTVLVNSVAKISRLSLGKDLCICIAPYREYTSKALRYDTRFQGISQFYLHTQRSPANGMNHTASASGCHPLR